MPISQGGIFFDNIQLPPLSYRFVSAHLFLIFKCKVKMERRNKSLWNDVCQIRKTSPLIHNITNYVVMNNTANALLAIGASPVMAHAIEEVEDMVSIASALVINMGTLSEKWIDAMFVAARKANELNIPIVLDPVGAGATSYRTQMAKRFIEECHPTVIRGNASEIGALVDETVQTKGVDSTSESHSVLEAAKWLAKKTGAVISISGEVDLVTDGVMVNEVHGGHAMMARVTGMGCTATAITASFVAVNPNVLEAATNAMELMSRVGESAHRQAKGPASLQLHFIDELYLCNLKSLER